MKEMQTRVKRDFALVGIAFEREVDLHEAE
jgi:hypothetical protein